MVFLPPRRTSNSFPSTSHLMKSIFLRSKFLTALSSVSISTVSIKSDDLAGLVLET
jgi:hypothetical protein